MHASSSTHANGRPVGRTSTGERIERGIPIPERIPFAGKRNNNGRPAKVDLSDLGVGDSVLIRAAGKHALARARTNSLNASKRASIKIITRSVVGGLRVWRTA